MQQRGAIGSDRFDSSQHDALKGSAPLAVNSQFPTPNPQSTHEENVWESRVGGWEFDPFCVVLEHDLDGQLHLARIPDAGPQEAVEIEQRR